MPIRGLNTEIQTQEEISTSISVNKGEPKTGTGKDTRAGKDLQEKFRLTILQPSLRAKLKKVYKDRGDFIEEKSVTTQLGKRTITEVSLYVEKLNIVCLSNDPHSTFISNMIKKEQQQKVWKCDRQIIHRKRESYKDMVGGVRYRWGNCEEQCKADPDNPYAECPAGCRANGIFYFYLWEFFDEGNFSCRLDTSSLTDIIDFPSQLESIAQEFGTLNYLNGVCLGDFRNLLPLELTRTPAKIARPQGEYKKVEGKSVLVRNGFKAQDVTFKLSIRVNPVWLRAYYASKKAEQLRLYGATASPTLVAQFVNADDFVIEATAAHTFSDRSTVASELKPLITGNPEPNLMLTGWQISDAELQELRDLWRSHSWTSSALGELLYSYFEISDRNQLKSINQEQFEQLKECLSSPEIKANFLS